MMQGYSRDVCRGEIIRQMHWQCWRKDAPPLETPLADLVAVLPALIESGSVGLVWPRLWHRADELGAVGAAMQAAYDAQVAHNARSEQDIARVVTRLRERGVEPVLIKGLAVARLYPAPLVRPAGDIDLVVRDEDYATATAVLADLHLSFHGDRVSQYAREASTTTSSMPVNVDLHRYSNWYGRGPDDSFFAGEVAHIGAIDVRVPGIEHHLRALCLHFLWHGAVRPLRLCDIGSLVESGDGRLLRNHLLAGSDVEREHVIVALRLAEHVLGACLDNSPNDVRELDVSRWVITTMLEGWEERSPLRHGRRSFFRGPTAAYRLATSRWPNPISAVVHSGNSLQSEPGFLALSAVFVQHWMSAALAFGRMQLRRLREPANPFQPKGFRGKELS